MMTRNKKYKIIALVLALFLAVTALATTLILNFNKSTVQAATIVGWDNKQEINVGSPLTIPDTVKVKVDNEYATVEDKYLLYPNGTVRVYGDYALDMVGEYTLLFKGTHNGEQFTAEQKFTVVNGAYIFSNSESKVSYVSLDDLADQKVYQMSNKVLTDKGSKKDLLTARGVKDGIISASLEQNDALKIDKVVNVYDLADKQGNVDICSFIPGNYTPVDEKNQVNNNVDTCFSLVKVVDCYDPTNYIEYYIWTGSLNGTNYSDYYVGAGASNQDMKGLSGPVTPDKINTKGDWVCVDDDVYRIYTVDRYTTGYAHGAYVGGIQYRSGLYTSNMMNLSFNVNDNRCYINGFLINDLDNNDLYPENEQQFKGFTTGEVYVQFEHAYSFAYIINFEIASVFDKSGAELKNGGIDDETAPVIKLDVEKTTNTSIFVAKGKQFTLPKAKVIDVNSTGDYNVQLYYNFSTDKQTTVSISNGKFTPSNIGVYTAVYTATDKYGNTSVETLNLISYDGETITYDDNNRLSVLQAGKINDIPSLNPVTVNKNVKEQVAIIYPDGTKVDFTDSKSANGYSIIPEYVGNCKIEYIFTDNVSSTVFSYDLTSSGENVYFKDALAIPTYMIKDAYYDIDNYFVYTPTATGLSPLQAEIYYSVDGGAEVKIENQHKFQVPAGENIKFRAKYGEQYSSEYFAKLVDLGFTAEKKDYKNYWQGYKAVSAISNAMIYTMDSDSSLSFVTPIALGAFAIDYKVEDSVKVNTYSIIITGIADRTEGLKITYSRIADDSKLLMYSIEDFNGKVYYKGEVSGSFAEKKSLTVTGDYYLVSGENVKVKIPELKSRNVEIKFDFTDATGEFNLNISKVCNQAFNSAMRKKDESNAQVVYKKTFKEYFKGDECYLPNFNVSSALYPTSLSNLKISIKKASNNNAFAKDKNGNELKDLVVEFGKEYSYMIDDVVVYRATFVYDDFYDNAEQDNITAIDGSYNIKSKDNQKPTVSFDAYKGQGIETVKLYTKYTFRNYTVADDITPEKELYVAFSVYNYKGDLEYWGKERNFTFTKAGTYTIKIFCQDSGKNSASASYQVEVK